MQIRLLSHLIRSGREISIDFKEQSSILHKTSDKIQKIIHDIPGINEMVKKINCKKLKDNIIMAIVIGVLLGIIIYSIK